MDGKHRWDACANMRVWLFETTPRFQGTIDSFNINTNEWAARSVPSGESVAFPDSYSKCCRKGSIFTEARTLTQKVTTVQPRFLTKKVSFYTAWRSRHPQSSFGLVLLRWGLEKQHSHKGGSHSWELYVKMTSRFLSVWLKVLVPLLDKTRPLFALQRQLFIVHSSDGRGQRSMTALLCFSWLGWACSQDPRPRKAGWTSVWFCYLHTSTHKHAAFYWCAHSPLLSFGQKQWPQRISHQSGAEIECIELSFCRNRVETLLSALMWILTWQWTHLCSCHSDYSCRWEKKRWFPNTMRRYK